MLRYDESERTSMKNNVLISIIMPVYKVEKYLSESIDSVVNQSYKNIEIILVDDGSPDNCGKICDEYAKKDNRIKVIHKVNEGVSVARNKGIEIANGEYVFFFDSDDIMCEGILEAIAENAKSDCDIQTYSIERISVEGHQIEDNELMIKEGTYEKNEFLRKYVGTRNGFPWGAGRNVYKMQLIKENNISFPKGITVAEDADFYMQYFNSMNGKIIYSNNKIIKYRANRIDSAMNSVNSKSITSEMKIYTKYFYNSNEYITRKIANTYKRVVFGIIKLQERDEREQLIEKVDLKILKKGSGMKIKFFILGCLIIGKKNMFEIFRKLRKC